jgi:hypothetical protein
VRRIGRFLSRLTASLPDATAAPARDRAEVFGPLPEYRN